ncbi:HAD hydrolase-like protein [Kribbella sp. NPDC026611]|uniref:HAD family hydrolase n=1 Tax=Kribbella sp. NPDC026611 TaxID=3154911 RepID=UPI0033C13A1A
MSCPSISAANGPHEVLAESANFGDKVWRRIEEALQVAEVRAVESATATPGVEAFLDACWAAGRPVAIVSNNCHESVRSYLDRANLAAKITHVEARDPNHAERMKPNPFLLEQALSALRC